MEGFEGAGGKDSIRQDLGALSYLGKETKLALFMEGEHTFRTTASSASGRGGSR